MGRNAAGGFIRRQLDLERDERAHADGDDIAGRIERENPRRREDWPFDARSILEVK